MIALQMIVDPDKSSSSADSSPPQKKQVTLLCICMITTVCVILLCILSVSHKFPSQLIGYNQAQNVPLE